eukprot:6492721-Amphidinium_carterae.6
MASSWAALAQSAAASSSDSGSVGASSSWVALASGTVSGAGASSWLQLASAVDIVDVETSVAAPTTTTTTTAQTATTGSLQNELAMAVKKRKVGRPKKDARPLLSLQAPVQAPTTEEPSAEIGSLELAISQFLESEVELRGEGSDLLGMMFPVGVDYQRQVAHGYTNPSSNSGVLCRVLAAPEQFGDTADGDYLKLHSMMLAASPEEFHLSSTTERALKLGMSKFSLASKLCRLMNAQVLSSRLMRFKMEEIVARQFSQVQKLAYIDAYAYDETPLKSCTSEGGFSPLSSGLHAVLESGNVADVGKAFGNVKDSVITKILQSKQSYGMVCRTDVGCLGILGETPNPLQCMEKGTAEVLSTCLEQSSGVSPWSGEFRAKARVACTDMNGANIKSEKHTGDGREQWARMQAFCEVHHTSRTFVKSFDKVLANDVRGMLHTALSLRYATGMATFRRCLKSIIKEKLRIMDGCPSLSSLRYREACLDVFVPEKGNLLKKTLLWMLPNGNWQNGHAVEYFPRGASMVDTDKEILSNIIAEGLTWCLAGKAPPAWPRHRWTGAAESVDALGLLCVCHSLLLPTYQSFAMCMSCPSASLSSRGVLKGMSAAGAATGVGGQSWNMVGEALPGTSLDVVGHVEATGADPALPEHLKSAEQHSGDIKAALEWMSEDPLAILLATRILMEPLRELLHHQFEAVSSSWEVKQRVMVAEHLMNFANEQSSTPVRQWMSTLAANCVHESTFLESLRKAVDPEKWWMLPESSYNAGFNNMAFKIMSRQGCCIEHYLGSVHKRFPWAFFKVIHNIGFLECVKSTPKCLLDDWSSMLLEKLEGCSANEVQQVLICHASLLSTNISHIESGHASIRRTLVQHSSNTWTMQIPYSSAMWVAQTLRRAMVSPFTKPRVVAKTCAKAKAKVKRNVRTLVCM